MKKANGTDWSGQDRTGRDWNGMDGIGKGATAQKERMIMTEEAKEQSLYFGGVSYDGEIKRLNEAWPTPQKGDELTDEQIVQVTGCREYQRRYRIMKRWSKQMLIEKGLVILRIKIKGWRFADDPDTVNHGEKIEKRRRKLLKNEVLVHNTVDRGKLSADDLARHEKHEERLSKHITAWTLDDSRPRGILKAIQDRNGAERK
jgi:hypothetical protein